MKTEILNPKDIFRKDMRYTVPEFQRRYVWTQDEQWEPLWEDVRNIAEDYLEKREAAPDDELVAERNTGRHFLGAVVIQQVPTKIKSLEQREVIDGQQRLTTLQLLLGAIQYVFETHDLKLAAKRLFKLVANDEELVADDDHIFKLWPTRGDQKAFRHAMHNGLPTDNYEASGVVQAHEYFQLQVREWLKPDGQLHSIRAEALEAAVTGMLQMVVIDLNEQDDPHLIFETLNARGTPLLESDLVKNFVMSKAGRSGNDDLWGALNDDWWRQEFKQGRLLRPRIDALLDYWLEMRTCDEVSAGRVFRTFRNVAADQRIEDVMSQLRGDLSNYRRYEEGPRNDPIENMFHYRVGVMDMGAFTPALLSILRRLEETRAGAFKALESFLVRRMMCRDTTKDYNRLALDLVRELNNREQDHTDSVVVNFLRGQTAPSRRWPTDRDVASSLSSLPLYRLLTRRRLRLILEGIEAQHRKEPKSDDPNVPKNLTIEHVLPRSWETHWPLPNRSDEAEEREKRNTIIHTIGNLTLVSGRLNAAVSNGPWSQKCEALRAHSSLKLNTVLLKESEDVAWDEEAILDRSKQMAAQVTKVWPGPDSRAWAEGA